MANLNDLFEDAINDTNETLNTLFNDIIIRTPIDTGACRANYKMETTIFDINSTNWAFLERKHTKRYLMSDKLQLSNTTPYLENLENGSSKQAPLGVFAITLIDFKRLLRRTQNGL